MIPVLTGIKFDLHDDCLILTGSDSDITIQTKIIKDEDLTIYSSSPTSKFDLNGTDILDYPRIDLSKNGIKIDINSLVLKNIISQTRKRT